MSTVMPYDYAGAREALSKAARQQRTAMTHARREYSRAAEHAAKAERAYRVALARKVLELKADGVAWTSTGDLARGDEQVARLRFERDVAEAVMESAREALRSTGMAHAADRRAVEQLTTWSMRLGLDGPEQPAVFHDVTARRAA